MKGTNLNKSPNLPESTDHMAGEGATQADMKRGFLKVGEEKRDAMFPDEGSMLDDSPSGFLTRPGGWER